MILHTWEWCSPGCDICVVCGVQQTADNPVSPECSGKTHKPSDVVVSRTDLEWAVEMLEADTPTVRHNGAVYNLRAALADDGSRTEKLMLSTQRDQRAVLSEAQHEPCWERIAEAGGYGDPGLLLTDLRFAATKLAEIRPGNGPVTAMRLRRFADSLTAAVLNTENQT